MNFANRALAVLGLCWCAVTSAHATVIQLTDTSALSTSDTTLNYLAPGTLYGSSAVFTAGSDTLSFSEDSGFTQEVVGSDYFTSAFALGTTVLAAGTAYSFNNPITLSFTTGVTEVGFNLEDYNALSLYSNYNVTFTAYNGSSALGTFATSGGPTSLGFLGLSASGGDQITSLVISDDVGNYLSFGSIQFANYSSGGGGTTTSAPEPGPLALMGAGLFALAALRKRNHTEPTV